jgi:hypothetical protein
MLGVLAVAVLAWWGLRTSARGWQRRHAWPWPLAISAVCAVKPESVPAASGPVRATGPVIGVHIAISVEAPACIPPEDLTKNEEDPWTTR